VLIHVAVTLLALLAMATFVIDYGAFWTSRRQAQNSADAAAYAGAIALAFDDAGNHTSSGPAKQTAWAISQRNFVWGEPPTVDIDADITFPACPEIVSGLCVRVDVHRENLPTFFGKLASVTAQTVRATATAEVVAGNYARCLKPWAVPDRWDEVTPVAGAPWTPASTFDKYVDTPPKGVLLPNPDVYNAPTSSGPGTGYRLDRDLGSSILLSAGSSADKAKPGVFLPVNLNPGCPSNCFKQAIATCVNTPFALDQALTPLAGAPLTFATATQQAVAELVALDPSAVFNPVTKKVENSCVGGAGHPYTCSVPGLTESPRVVAIPAFNVGKFEDGKQLNKITIKIANILAVFLDGLSGNDVNGHLIAKSGTYDPNAGMVFGGSGFTNAVLIVR
jgi:hypothetical protein